MAKMRLLSLLTKAVCFILICVYKHTLNHLNHPAGLGEKFGGIFATPAIAEKGYTDVRIEVSSPGGHSSVPPPHTVS